MAVAIRNFVGAQTIADIEPNEDYLVVECGPPEQITETGIVMPGEQSESGTADLRPVGTVKKVGPGHYENGHFVEQFFAPGDIVYFRTSDYAALAPQFAMAADGELATLVRARTVYAFVRGNLDGVLTQELVGE